MSVLIQHADPAASLGNDSSCTAHSDELEEAAAPLPLCVDLDGTLIYTDSLWECLILVFKHNPACLFLIPLWFVTGGRPKLKRQLARRAFLDPEKIPYNQELLQFLRTERACGRQIVLVTASDQQLAERIAVHAGVFDQVHGTKAGNNLKGSKKGDFLRAKYGHRRFEYVGNSASDMHVWDFANAAYIVGSDVTAEKVSSVTTVRRLFPRRKDVLNHWLRAIRIHHWTKNLLMLAPLLLAHRLAWQPLIMTLLGVICFGLCSSGVYVFNDLLDLHSDRAHTWKNGRPFASGDLSIGSGIAAFLVLEVIALGLGALVLNVRFAGLLGLYVATAACYSLWLKRIVILDVFVLSSFYIFRIWAGALITATPLSQWFLGFSLFFFLSLAMAKRYSELVQASNPVQNGNSGRGYKIDDRALLMNIGIASCFSAIVVLSLYVHSPEVVALYGRPGLLLLMCPILLYWTSRIWVKAHRGELNEDPVTLAMRDVASYCVAGASVGVILLSSPKP